MLSYRKFLYSVIMVCFLANFLNAADITVVDKETPTGGNTDYSNKVREGVLSMLSAAEVQDAVSIVFQKGNRNDSMMMDSWQKPWDKENIGLIEEAFHHYMESYGIVVSPDKIDLIANHLQRFAAFKAAVFSS